MDYDKRLDAIYSSVQSLVKEHSPDVAVVEEIFFSRNVKTAITVGQARGVILLSLNHAGELLEQTLEVVELNPTTSKKILTGSGNSDKKAIQRIVKQELDLTGLPEPDDAADALAHAMSFCIDRRFESNLEEH